MKKILTYTMFTLLFLILVINILMMPGDSGVDAPSYNDTVHHYLNESVNETGATNIVAAILADYRAFDTLGETIVLFTSIVAVASILKPAKADDMIKEEDNE
jgi:multisubunit Na+/H+ antiporter MnhB subunit